MALLRVAFCFSALALSVDSRHVKTGCAKGWVEGAGFGTEFKLGGSQLTRQQCVQKCYDMGANGAQMPDDQLRGDCYCIMGMAAINTNPVLLATYVEECTGVIDEEEDDKGAAGMFNANVVMMVLASTAVAMLK